jgi:hypothetical protein
MGYSMMLWKLYCKFKMSWESLWRCGKGWGVHHAPMNYLTRERWEKLHSVCLLSSIHISVTSKLHLRNVQPPRYLEHLEKLRGVHARAKELQKTKMLKVLKINGIEPQDKAA